MLQPSDPGYANYLMDTWFPSKPPTPRQPRQPRQKPGPKSTRVREIFEIIDKSKGASQKNVTIERVQNRIPVLPSVMYVYILLDPSDNQWRYVGITKNPFGRYDEHVCKKANKHKSKKNIWMRNLLDSGKNPLMVLLHRCAGCHDAWQVEYDYIKLYRYTISNTRCYASPRDARFTLGKSKIVRPKIIDYPTLRVPALAILTPAT